MMSRTQRMARFCQTMLMTSHQTTIRSSRPSHATSSVLRRVLEDLTSHCDICDVLDTLG